MISTTSPTDSASPITASQWRSAPRQHHQYLKLAKRTHALHARKFGESPIYPFAARNSALLDRFAETIAYSELASEDDAWASTVIPDHANALLEIGDHDRARVLIEKLDQFEEVERTRDYRRVYFYRILGDLAGLESFIKTALEPVAADDDSVFQALYTATAAEAYLLLGQYDKAADLYETYFETRLQDPDQITDLFAYIGLAHALEKTGRVDSQDSLLTEAAKILEKFEREGHSNPDFFLASADVQVLLGDHEGAIATLQDAYNAGVRRHHFMTVWPVYDAIRHDPRFVELMRKMREDADRVRAEVDSARETGDWLSLVSEDFVLD